jgi:hypothetical protein
VIVGYARVSTDGQTFDDQVAALRAGLLRCFVTCLMTVLTSVPFGVRAGRRMVATGVPLGT